MPAPSASESAPESASGSASGTRAARPRRVRVAWALLLGALALVFVGLAAWQVERRAWKHALIAQVEHRVSMRPVDAPTRDRWADVDAVRDAYRRVVATGHFVEGGTTLVRAATVLGSGYWVMTPLRRDDGTTVLVNRGFVSGDGRLRLAPVRGDARVVVTGLLRITEPRGGFLADNDPAADRWVSRDVQAIAAARRLTDVAPYFVDADGGQNPAEDGGAADAARGVPVGGLTVVAFTDHHLPYAVTWAVLAALCTAAAARVARGTGQRDARASGLLREEHEQEAP